jgi:hypothetical protein
MEEYPEPDYQRISDTIQALFNFYIEKRCTGLIARPQAIPIFTSGDVILPHSFGPVPGDICFRMGNQMLTEKQKDEFVANRGIEIQFTIKGRGLHRLKMQGEVWNASVELMAIPGNE